MYKEIDELIDVIVNDEVFQCYVKGNELLKDKDVQSLLIKHQDLQDDYLKLKQYESYISIDETKEKLKEMLDSCGEKKCLFKAKPQGLYLQEVFYEKI